MVITMSIKNMVENSLKVDTPIFFKAISFCRVLVSLTKYQAKNVKKSLVMIAEKIRGLKIVMTRVTAKDHTNIGL